MNDTADTLDSAAKTSTWMGVLTVIIGIIALGSPMASGVALTYMIAVLLIIGGITRSIYAFQAGSLGKGLLMLAFGGITVLAGLALFSNPVLGLATITIILFHLFPGRRDRRNCPRVPDQARKGVGRGPDRRYHLGVTGHHGVPQLARFGHLAARRTGGNPLAVLRHRHAHDRVCRT